MVDRATASGGPRVSQQRCSEARQIQLRTGVSSGNFVWYCQDRQRPPHNSGVVRFDIGFHAAHFAGCPGRANVGSWPTDAASPWASASNLQGPTPHDNTKVVTHNAERPGEAPRP